MIIEGLNGVREEHDFVTLGKLLAEWELTDVQRVIDMNRVKNITDSIRRKENVQGTFSFMVAEVGGRRHLVDGQHRLAALQQLHSEMNLDGLLIHVRTIPVVSDAAALKLVNEMGNVSPVYPVSTVEERACLNQFEYWLQSCVNKPSKSRQPHYGNFSTHFLEIVRDTGFFEKFKKEDRMLEKCKELNRWVFQSILHISRSKMSNVRDLASFICPDLSRFEIKSFETFCKKYSKTTTEEVDRLFCLHFIVNYGFAEVVRYMCDLSMSASDLYRNQIQHKDTSKRLTLNFNRGVDKGVEKEVIRKFFSEETRDCPVCLLSSLHMEDRSTFALGHITAHSRGGLNTPKNLIPICHRCNLDCRAEDLKAYGKRRYGTELPD